MVQDGLAARDRDQPLDPTAVAEWVEARIPFCRPFEGFFAAQPIYRDDKIAAAVIWHNYDSIAGNVEAAIAADTPRWISREQLGRIFYFPFGLLGCKRVTARVSVLNTRSRKFVEGVGFQLEGLMRQAYADGSDMLIYGMLKSECRFLRKEWLDG